MVRHVDTMVRHVDLLLADIYGIYKSNESLLIKKTSFEVKHCKIETVLVLRSAQAGKLKKTYI